MDMTGAAKALPKKTLDLSPKSLLIKGWLIFGTLSQIISVASLLQDLVAWGPFVRDMIQAYRRIVDALWGPLLDLVRIDLPRWTHDYLTITGLMSVSVLWCLYQTSKAFGWGGLGSVFGVLRNSILNFSIGGNSLQLFADGAKRALAKHGTTDAAAEAQIDHLARRPAPWLPVALGILILIFFVVALVCLPLAIPALMYLADHLDTAQFRAVLKARIAEAHTTITDPARRALVAAELERTLGHCDVTAQTNAFYYRTILKEIGIYYIFVMVAFVLLVFANFAFTSLLPHSGKR